VGSSQVTGSAHVARWLRRMRRAEDAPLDPRSGGELTAVARRKMSARTPTATRRTAASTHENAAHPVSEAVAV
jgi:hypothetical protein